MAIFDAGMFVLLLGIAVFSMILSFKIGAVLQVISIVLFFGLSLIMFGQYDVMYLENFYGTSECPESDPCVTQKIIISDNQSWLAWIFVAFGIFSSMLFFLEMVGFFDATPQINESDF